jgi:hypothetical protein
MKEKGVVREFQAILGGETEVTCKFGRVDLLTSYPDEVE